MKPPPEPHCHPPSSTQKKLNHCPPRTVPAHGSRREKLAMFLDHESPLLQPSSPPEPLPRLDLANGSASAGESLEPLEPVESRRVQGDGVHRCLGR